MVREAAYEEMAQGFAREAALLAPFHPELLLNWAESQCVLPARLRPHGVC
jgi:hypothetical protein